MTGAPSRFSFRRVGAVLVKEFIQMRRDRLTFALILGVPLMQLLLFGFAINNDPKHLPTAVSISDPGVFSDSIVSALANSGYFDIVQATNSPAVAKRRQAPIQAAAARISRSSVSSSTDAGWRRR